MPAPLLAEEFAALKQLYPNPIPAADLPDIPWGRLTDIQFAEFKTRVNATFATRPAELRRKQTAADLFPTRQANGTWLRALDWGDLTNHLRTTDAIFGRAFDDFMPEHWFNYFWINDALGSQDVISEAEKKKFVTVAQEFFVYDKAQRKPRLQTELNGLLRNAPAARVCALLEAALECAFTRVAMPSQASQYDAQMRLVNDFSRWLKDSGTKANRTQMGWRCETRTYAQVVNAGGLNRQVDAEVRRRTLHFDQPWHPFSKPQNLNCFWYRRSNKDNDNFLVVSVAQNFLTALTFPKLDLTFSSAANGQRDLTRWPPSVQADFKDYIYDIHFTDGTVRRKIVQHVNVFLFLVRGDFFDTQGYQGQGSFPEWGVSNIPRSLIWGAIPVTKVYHGLDDGGGFTAIIDVAKARSQIQPYTDRRNNFGPLWISSLEREFSAALAQPQLGAMWTGTGGVSVHQITGDRQGVIQFVKKVGHVALLRQAFENNRTILTGRQSRF
jgi:hypothetical protein